MVQLVKCLQHDQRCNLQFPSTHMKKLDMACACNFSGGGGIRVDKRGFQSWLNSQPKTVYQKLKHWVMGRTFTASTCTWKQVNAHLQTSMHHPPHTHKINSRKQTFILPTYLPTQDKVSVCSLDWRWNLLCRPGWSWTQRITCLWLRSTGIKGMYPQTRPNLQMIFM